MRFQRCLCLVFFCAVLCCIVFSVSSFAAESGLSFVYYDYAMQVTNLTTGTVFDVNSTLTTVSIEYGSVYEVVSTTSSVPYVYIRYKDNSELPVPTGTSPDNPHIFTRDEILSIDHFDCNSATIYGMVERFYFMLEEPKCDGSGCPSTDANKDNVCDDCGFKFLVERDYTPFTVKKFMNHIGQILTSAVSWVGNVGSTILEQPLLLAFTALPLCGLGIAVFRRLKETV